MGSLVERVERYAVRGGEEPPMVAKREDEVDALRVAVSFAWRAIEEWVRNEVKVVIRTVSCRCLIQPGSQHWRIG